MRKVSELKEERGLIIPEANVDEDTKLLVDFLYRHVLSDKGYPLQIQNQIDQVSSVLQT